MGADLRRFRRQHYLGNAQTKVVTGIWGKREHATPERNSVIQSRRKRGSGVENHGCALLQCWRLVPPD